MQKLSLSSKAGRAMFMITLFFHPKDTDSILAALQSPSF